jgi:hypothetical protein
MTYKETLFFVGQSLTINHSTENKIAIEKLLKENSVDWDAVVKVSTGHFVFPALYCNLKRAHFLHYLPEELVNYMVHITDLNRERNQKIIDQAKEINTLLLANNITPIFLKGTGNLLEGLYEDIAERMVGDIDFIVSKEEYLKTVEIFLNLGFETVVKDENHFPQFKHYPRLFKNVAESIAGIEIHKELLSEKYANEFNYDIVKKDVQILNNIHVLSYANQLSLSIIAKQINDFGYYHKTISLRNGYDVFLLSQKTNAKKDIAFFNNIFEPLNSFLAICYEVMGKISLLEYTETKKTKKFMAIFHNNLNDEKIRVRNAKKATIRVFFIERFDFLKYAIFNKEYRQWILKRATDKKWQEKKLIQLGLKKQKIK